MSHMVIVHTTAEKSFFPCDDLNAAIATIERFRNEDNVESCELYELSPISFEFKPYYHVALSTGATGSAAIAAGGSSLAMETDAPAPSAALSESFGAEPLTSELNAPVLSAVESPNPFDTVGQGNVGQGNVVQEPAVAAPVADPLGGAPAQPVVPAAVAPNIADAPLGFPEAAPSSLDATYPPSSLDSTYPPSSLDSTLSDVGVHDTPPLPPLSESIPPVPPFGEVAPDPMATLPAIDPFDQSPSEAAAVATGSTSSFGFELGEPSAASEFDPVAPEASSVSDLFGSSAELPPPPPPPPLETEVDKEPRRGLFGR